MKKDKIAHSGFGIIRRFVIVMKWVVVQQQLDMWDMVLVR